MDDGQKTLHGYPDFNSYVKILCVLVFRMDGWTDRQTDGQTEKTPDVHGLEELLSAVLERFLKPIHALRM
jgi:hypothetical protein